MYVNAIAKMVTTTNALWLPEWARAPVFLPQRKIITPSRKPCGCGGDCCKKQIVQPMAMAHLKKSVSTGHLLKTSAGHFAKSCGLACVNACTDGDPPAQVKAQFDSVGGTLTGLNGVDWYMDLYPLGTFSSECYWCCATPGISSSGYLYLAHVTGSDWLLSHRFGATCAAPSSGSDANWNQNSNYACSSWSSQAFTTGVGAAGHAFVTKV